jgi:hypothetical protein
VWAAIDKVKDPSGNADGDVAEIFEGGTDPGPVRSAT